MSQYIRKKGQERIRGRIQTPGLTGLRDKLFLATRKITAAGVHLCAKNFTDGGLYFGHSYSERVALPLA